MLTFRPVLGLAMLALVSGCGDGAAPAEPDAAPPIDAAAPPAFALFDYPLAIDVSPDGSRAVFQDFAGGVATVVVHDTATGVSTTVAELGDPARTLATGVAATGRISAMRNEPLEAALWSPTGSWLDLGSPFAAGCGDAEVSGAFDVSADGHVAVGLAWDGCVAKGFRWSDASGAGAFAPLAVLGQSAAGPGTAPTNRATVVSDDGRVAAGFAENGPIDRSPAVWQPDGTGELLDPTNVDAPGEVLAIDGTGTALAGQRGNDGFVWTRAAGFVAIPRLPAALPSDPVYPNAMTADGTRVFGGIGNAFFTTPLAFVWSATAGTRDLTELATASGVALPTGTILTSVLGASADGTVLIGTAMDAAFAPKTFVLRLPASAL